MNNTIAFFLENIQSPINLAHLFRITHFFDLHLKINDISNTLKSANKKQLHDFSSGSFSLKNYTRVSNNNLFNPKTRVIATVLDPNVTCLQDFTFEPGDTVVLGNEYQGISDEIIQLADHCITIPSAIMVMPKEKSFSPIANNNDVNNAGGPCLNVSIAAAIIAYEIRRQMPVFNNN